MKEVDLMDFDKMNYFLSQHYTIKEIKDIPHGKQIILKEDANVTVYNKGSYQVQGKNAAEVRGKIENGEIDEQKSSRSNNIFVVYGHDENAKTELESILRRWGFEPICLDQLASGGKTIIEKLETEINNVEYGVVLATPDDIGYRKDAESEKMFRCRQNVVLELGMLLSRLGRDRVAILQKDAKNTERPSDIQGLLYIPFENKIGPEASKILAREIENKLKRIIPASLL